MLFDDGSGGGTRRHDLASRALAGDEERPIGFEDLVLQAHANRTAIVPLNTRQSAQATLCLRTRVPKRMKATAGIVQVEKFGYIVG